MIIYAVTTPIFVYVWWIYFTILILISPADSPGITVVLMPMAIIVAIQLLAHVNKDAAYHLGSVVPMVLIASILIGQQGPGDDAIS